MRDEEGAGNVNNVSELQSIWCEVLGVDSVGIDDDFFDLGGTSLKGADLIFTIEERFEVEIPVELIFETPTIRGVAARLKALERNPRKLTRLSPDDVRNKPAWFLSSDADSPVECGKDEEACGGGPKPVG